MKGEIYMHYENRNLATLNTLADRTKAQALKLYAYAKEIGFEILIYEGIRSVEQQRRNVANKKSQTMKSYHIVGQAFDFVPVNASGEALWNMGAYVTPKGLKFIAKAKSLGFTWGADWNNNGKWTDEKFVDSPHLQYTYKGYGTDSFSGKKVAPVSKNVADATIKKIQSTLNARYGTKLTVDGYAGAKTQGALTKGLKTELNKHFTKEMGKTLKSVDESFGAEFEKVLAKVAVSSTSKTPERFNYILQAALYCDKRKEVGTPDGIWGAKTTTAVKNAQRLHGLSVDGVVGAKTWKALLK